MDWTDRHCRFFLRQISRHARLYTEMVTAPALMHGDVPRHLDFDPAEHPVALQLGGSDPAMLAHAAQARRALGLRRDQPQLRLSVRARADGQLRRVPDGASPRSSPTACARCATRSRCRSRSSTGSASTPTRTTASSATSSGTVADAGCDVFIVHARNAVLKGLSPKENREVPRLRYDVVHRLKRDFPALTIVLNGGLDDVAGDRARTRARRRRDARPRRVSRPDGARAGRLAPVRRRRRRCPRAPACCAR